MRHYAAALVVALTLVFAGSVRAQADSAGTAAITDARLGSNVENRMIVQEATSFPVNSKVYLWLKVEGATSGELTVTWKTASYSHTATLAIGGSPWRTWATKTVRQAGKWTVTVTDEGGKVLKELDFTVE